MPRRPTRMRNVLPTAVLAVLVAGCSPASPEEPSGNTTDPSQDTVAEVFSSLQEGQAPAWTKGGEVVDTDEISAFAGPEHCSWEKAVFLHLGWPPGTVSQTSRDSRQYLRDPGDVIEVDLQDELDLAARLPDDAEDTTYRLGDLQLWLAPSDADGAYLRLGDGAERWPRANPPIACAWGCIGVANKSP